MAIKIGDKIRFLNSVGGGIVTKFQGKDQVLVEDEDGFEIPAFIRECVVIEENKMQVHSKNQPKANLQENLTKAQENTSKEKEEITITETPEGERLNIAVAYLPLDPKALQQSAYEAYFINDSNYFLFYNYMSRQGNSWFSRSNGVIEPNTKIFMEEFSKEDLNNLERICVQLIGADIPGRKSRHSGKTDVGICNRTTRSHAAKGPGKPSYSPTNCPEKREQQRNSGGRPAYP